MKLWYVYISVIIYICKDFLLQNNDLTLDLVLKFFKSNGLGINTSTFYNDVSAGEQIENTSGPVNN